MHKVSYIELLKANWIEEMFMVFGLIFLTSFVSFMLRFFYTRYFKPTKSDAYKSYTHMLVHAAYTPLLVVVWLLGITIAIQVTDLYNDYKTIPTILSIVRKVGIAVLFIWFTVRFITAFQTRLVWLSQKGELSLDVTTIQGICHLLRMTVVISSILVILQVFGIPVSGLLAFGGVGGIGVALASQDLLANFFGGFMIFMDRPFEVGDWIRSPDKEIEGTVEHIGWRLTCIRTFDKRARYIPNKLFTTLVIDNPSRMTNRRIKTVIGLRYKDADRVHDVLAAIEQMLRNHPEIDTSKTLFVKLVEFGPSSLDFLVYTFTKTVDWVKYQSVQQDVFLKILDVIKEHGAECAFPEQVIHLQNEYPEEPVD